MEKLSILEVTEAINGKILGNFERLENKYIESISIDSRKIEKNALFIPLHGENINSHKFIVNAFLNGAIATLTDEDVYQEKDKLYIKVEDTLKAMQDLASFYRQKFNIKVIGITGSVGKTSTKEMISCVLESKYKVLKTKGNLNGQVGLPLTIFNLNSDFDIAVVEMGISMPNEMDRLSYIARPNDAVLSNVGVTHIENFKTQQNILKEKLKVTNTLEKNSTLFINGDNENLFGIKEKYQGKFNVLSFGMKNNADYVAKNIEIEGQNTNFDLIFNNGKKERFTIPVIGDHNVYNALSSIAVGLKYGLSIEEIKLALKNYKTLKMRQCIFDVNFEDKNITLIDDTYNANPDSMRSALEVLSLVGKERRKIAILSDMLELGEYSSKLHFEIGEFAVSKDVDILLTVGEEALNISKGAEQNNKKTVLCHFKSNEDCFIYLKNILKSSDIILAKGSRGMHLEEIINKLIKKD